MDESYNRYTLEECFYQERYYAVQKKQIGSVIAKRGDQGVHRQLTRSLVVSVADIFPLAFVKPYELVLLIVPAIDPWKEKIRNNLSQL